MNTKCDTKRILVISDSLGTPIHARGIFNFTCSAVQIFKKLGFETCLLIEPPNISVIKQTKQKNLTELSSLGTNYAIIADVLKHFTGDRFRFSWSYSDESLQRFSCDLKSSANFRLAMNDTKNFADQIEIGFNPEFYKEYKFSQETEHLKMFSSFLLSKDVYSESFRRAYLNLRPITVDASNFDYVYIDTPHFIVPYGIDKSKIICVVHDFIPFFDVAMGFDWRQLFISKIECSIKTAGALVFNSKTTQNYFERIYGNTWNGRQVIVYPPNRSEIERACVNINRMDPSNYLVAIRPNKVEEQKSWVQKITTKLHDNSALRKHLTSQAVWLDKLPFFCSVLSDEPRKNIALIVSASKRFVGRANFIIMGQIDGNRYTENRPEDFPNLHFTGYVSDVQKFDLLRSCTGFIFPSLMEGFGIPIVEASMFGAPILCADTEVFREITFNKARYFDANNDASLSNEIDALLLDVNRNAVGQELKQQSEALFSQDSMSKRMMNLLNMETKL